jgi:hypothetical protein
MMKQITFNLMFMTILVMNTHGQSGGIIVAPGTTVTQEAGTTIDINNGSLVLKDDLSTAPSFLQKGIVSYTGNGDSKVEQYLAKDKWHIVSPPVQNEVNGAYMWMYLYNWTETSWSWQFMNQPVNQSLNPGQGYYAWAYTTDPNGGGYQTSPDSVVLNGTLNHQDLNLNLSVTDASPKSGWNLLGNPFPCGLDWNGNTEWNLTNLDATIWIWDPMSGNHKFWNYNTGGSLQSGEIAATQGFWVHADDTTGTVSTSLTLPVSQRVHSTNNFYKSGGSTLPNQLKLKVQGSSPENDECIIGFHNGATAQLNNMLDALYLKGGETAPSLYTSLLGNNYAMKQLSSWKEYNTVPMVFNAAIPGIYMLSASWIESFPADLPIYLEDKKESSFLNLRENPQYEFTAGINDDKDRFIVHFGSPQSVNIVKALEMVKIYSNGKTVHVNITGNELNEGMCTIYNMMGKKVIGEKVENGDNAIPVTYNKGYYVVTVNFNRGFTTKKVFIN